MAPLENGYFQVEDPHGKAGDLYTFTVDEDANNPDFASRYQPTGVMDASQVIDPQLFRWTAANWSRPEWGGQVLYEITLALLPKKALT